MEAVQWIVSYIREHATPVEKEEIKMSLRMVEAPKLDTQRILETVITKSREIYQSGNKLNAVKYVKEATGWGLKESKEWLEKMFD